MTICTLGATNRKNTANAGPYAVNALPNRLTTPMADLSIDLTLKIFYLKVNLCVDLWGRGTELGLMFNITNLSEFTIQTLLPHGDLVITARHCQNIS